MKMLNFKIKEAKAKKFVLVKKNKNKEIGNIFHSLWRYKYKYLMSRG